MTKQLKDIYKKYKNIISIKTTVIDALKAMN